MGYGNIYKFTGASGVNELSHMVSVGLFPNPASDFITLKTEQFNSIKKIEIAGIEGKTVCTLNNPQDRTICIRELNQGVYFITVSTDKGVFLGKFTKSNN